LARPIPDGRFSEAGKLLAAGAADRLVAQATAAWCHLEDTSMSSTAQLVPLATIVPPLNHEVGGGFDAIVAGERVRVRAVLERTVVIEHGGNGDRSVVRKELCMVEAASVPFIPGNPSAGVGPRQWRRLPGKPPQPQAR
jgi:hypothetical protein